MDNPILRAAKDGDAAELKELLKGKMEYFLKQQHNSALYPDDWKYHFQDLLETDQEGRTALHWAAAVGNHDMALESVKVLLESIQVLYPDEDGTPLEKTKTLVNAKDKYKETPLHLAIENRATEVVAYLLENQANIVAKNRNGVEALPLIYEHVPDAMCQIYNDSIELTSDHKKFRIKWGPVIGIRNAEITSKANGGDDYRRVTDYSQWNESVNLKYVLRSDRWGAPILLHPLVKLYLERKWNKIHWFFWVPFIFEMLWLFLYAVAFVALHLELKANGTEECKGVRDFSDNCQKGYHILWMLLFPLTLICAIKEIYQVWVLRKAYISFENLVQDLFILLFIVQFGVLMAGYSEVVASLSAIGVILSTLMAIFQLGKTPYFGLQVAALKKVIYSCAPHLPVFCVWFIGFGLIFWAIFYKAEESWLVGMVAIMAAMGTGELNAQDHLEPEVDDGHATSFRECVRVFSLLFFVIFIVTLYFNLLIGYAVSDIQILKEKAEALELRNRLNTIFTMEFFLITDLGQWIVLLKHKLTNCLGSDSTEKVVSMDTIYVMPPTEFQESGGIQEINFQDIPPKLLMNLRKVAHTNIVKKKEAQKVMAEKIRELIG